MLVTPVLFHKIGEGARPDLGAGRLDAGLVESVILNFDTFLLMAFYPNIIAGILGAAILGCPIDTILIGIAFLIHGHPFAHVF